MLPIPLRPTPLAFAVAGACTPPPYAAHGDVEARFLEEGPHAVLPEPEIACCDEDGNPFHAWLPDTDSLAPLVIWGNGSGARSDYYRLVIQHVVSWGFVVIAPESPAVGDAEPLLMALDVATEGHGDSSSPLHGRVDLDRVGAMGHSQGAGGVTNLKLAADERVHVVVSLHRPHPQWCSTQALCPRLTALDSGAILFITGSRDKLMAPPVAQKRFYRDVPEHVAKARGTIRGANHNDVLGQPDCDDAATSLLCRLGATPFLGYPTAWLVGHLQDDENALAAFIEDGEFARAQPHWQDAETNLRSGGAR